MTPSLAQEKHYTIDDIYSLPENSRAELIDGQIYYMAPPNRRHQTIARELFFSINSYIQSQNGPCECFFAPFAVFLNRDDTNYVEPDISVICDPHKLNEKGCTGAPDWIIEIASPSTSRIDCAVKLFKYRTAGVREYWIVNPQKKTVMVYDFEKNLFSNQYNFGDDIPVCIYNDLSITVGKLT